MTSALAGAAARDGERRMLAVLCMIGGVLLLTTQDSISKWVVVRHHVGEIMAYRGIVAVAALMFWLAWRGELRLLRSTRPGLNLLRASINTFGGLFLISSLRWMALADVMTIFFASPIMIAALSGPLLGERVGLARWTAILVGFAGMLLMVGPSGSAVGWVVAMPMVAMVCISLRDIMTRKLGAGDTAVAILFYTVTVPLAVGLASLPIAGWTPPSAADAALLVLAGLFNTVGQALSIFALTLAPAALLAPLRYLALVWAVGIGIVVWGDVPGPTKVAGAVLIVMAGLAVARSGRRPVAA